MKDKKGRNAFDTTYLCSKGGTKIMGARSLNLFKTHLNLYLYIFYVTSNNKGLKMRIYTLKFLSLR